MARKPINLRVLAQGKEDENWKFRQFLKIHCDLDSEELDELVFELTKDIWAGIDCTTCANCCKEVRPTFTDEEIDRLAKRLGMDRGQLIEANLEKTSESDDNPWRTRTTPCPFLKDNLCSVYDDRPADCRNYPYLYKPEFGSRLIGMIQRTFTCPIVYEVMEALKPSVGFPPRKKRSRGGW